MAYLPSTMAVLTLSVYVTVVTPGFPFTVFWKMLPKTPTVTAPEATCKTARLSKFLVSCACTATPSLATL